MKKVPLFADFGDSFASEIAARLEVEIYVPDDIVLQHGEFKASIYFIRVGKFEICMSFLCLSLQLSYEFKNILFSV